MRPEEITLPEMLRDAGYRTGIFGKWHLGDNYPLRPIDQGFVEALVHRGGGIGQPSDPPGGDSYFDPTLLHNGSPTKTQGYCSDVYTDAAIKFIQHAREKPFFVYLAFNAPHDPLEVPDAYRDRYSADDLTPEKFRYEGQPLPAKLNADAMARVYGMVTNIDDNVGRLLARLDELKLAEDTIVVFLTDNGPAFPRYNAGLRGLKGTVYDGGIRVPCFVRWPAKLRADRDVPEVAAHIDLTPTLLDACGVAPHDRANFDGRSLLPLLTGDVLELPARSLFFQWHRGDVPQPWRACAVRSGRWKLVQPAGVGERDALPPEPKVELYDLEKDPYEQRDVAVEHPEVVARLKREYDRWFADVTAAGFEPPRIVVGSDSENPTLLTRQDWRGPEAGWGPKSVGHWELEVAEAGAYTITVRFAPAPNQRTARLSVQDVTHNIVIPAGAREASVESIELKPGHARISTWSGDGDERAGAEYVEIRQLP